MLPSILRAVTLLLSSVAVQAMAIGPQDVFATLLNTAIQNSVYQAAAEVPIGPSRDLS